jgi:homoaconitase/3-isopropylmalate dehydratase large subunit
MTARTLFEKVWEQHQVVPETADTPAVLYIDLHLVHEVTSPQAFAVLRAQGLKVRRTDRTLATMDHSTPTDPDEVFGRVPIKVESAARQVKELEKNARELASSCSASTATSAASSTSSAPSSAPLSRARRSSAAIVTPRRTVHSVRWRSA